MVNAKKEKKGVGAERRREEKLDQYYSELKQRRKSSGKSSKSEKGKRKPKKKEGGEPTESRVNWQLVGALLRRVAALAFTILIFSRSNIGEAFGTGTGINKAQVSPVNIVVHSLLHADFIKKDKQFNAKAKLVSQALIYPSVYIGPYMPKKMQPLPSKMKYGGNGPKDSAWDKANAVMKTIDNDQGLKKLMAYENKDMVVVAAVGIILGALVAPFWGVADNISALGMALTYGGMTSIGGRLSTLFWYALACVIVGYLTTFLTEEDSKKPKGRKRRKRPVVAAEEESEESDGDEAADDATGEADGDGDDDGDAAVHSEAK